MPQHDPRRLMKSLGCVAAFGAALFGGAGAAQAGTATTRFDSAGEHRIVIGAGVTSLDVTAAGGHGGKGDNDVPGGKGALVSGVLSVRPPPGRRHHPGGR